MLIRSKVTWGLGVWVDYDGFGMGGLGGSLGMADPALGLAEAYVTRHLAGHDRAGAMDAALRAALPDVRAEYPERRRRAAERSETESPVPAHSWNDRANETVPCAAAAVGGRRLRRVRSVDVVEPGTPSAVGLDAAFR